MKRGINYCPVCGCYLTYDSDSNEWYCTGDCNYTESDKSWSFKKKYRDVDE